MEKTTFKERSQKLIEFYASNTINRSKEEDPTGYVKSAIYTAMARYASGDIEKANKLADYIYNNPARASMFLVMGGMDLYMRYNKHMSDETKKKARKYITGYDDYTGGSTENHHLMFATGGYLASEEWQDWERSENVNKKTKKYIMKFVDNIAKYGMKEHDSPTYHIFYVNCMLSLYDHASDQEIKNKAKIGLEILIADMAAEWLKGNWCSSTLRTYYFTYNPYVSELSGLLGWLYWGGCEMPPQSDGIAIMSAVSSYRLPDVLKKIGKDRSFAYTHRESHDLLPDSQLNKPAGFRKYNYMNKEFSLFSQYDGNGSLGWHDQMQRWGLVWVSEYPQNTFLLKHPVSWIRGDTANNQVLQHKNVLVGVSCEDMEGYLPLRKHLKDEIIESKNIFIDTGSVYFAFQSINEFEWEDNIKVRNNEYRKIKLPEGNNGWIVEVYLADEIKNLQEFSKKIKQKTVIDGSGITKNKPELKYKDLSGNQLEIKFDDNKEKKGTRLRKINGKPIKYEKWPRVENPWMNAEVGGEKWILKYNNKKRLYYIDENKIIDK